MPRVSPFTRHEPQDSTRSIFTKGEHFFHAPRLRRLPNFSRTAPHGVDIMDSGAACRTYNVLLSEARRVAAALLPV